LKRTNVMSMLLGIVLITTSLSFPTHWQVVNLIFVLLITTPRLQAYVYSFFAFQRYKKEMKEIEYDINDEGISFSDKSKVSSGQTKWSFFPAFTLRRDYATLESKRGYLPFIFLAKSCLSHDDWLKITELVKTHVKSEKRFLAIKMVIRVLIIIVFYLLFLLTVFWLSLSVLQVYNFQCAGWSCAAVTKPTSNQWQVYTNKTYKYTFQYPPEMYADKTFYNPEKEEKHVRLVFFNPTKKEIPVKNGFGNMVYENEITIMFLGDNLSDEEIETYDRQYKNFYSNDKESVTQPEFIHGKTQYRYEKRDKINDFYYLNSIYSVDNRFFEISLRALYVSPQLKEVYEKILDSVTPQ